MSTNIELLLTSQHGMGGSAHFLLGTRHALPLAYTRVFRSVLTAEVVGLKCPRAGDLGVVVPQAVGGWRAVRVLGEDVEGRLVIEGPRERRRGCAAGD